MEIKRNTIEIENAQIRFKNFSGVQKQANVGGRMTVVNDQGNRNFNVILDPTKSNIYWNKELVTNPDFGQELASLGFSVSVKPGREEGESTEYRLPVHIGFGNITPEIYLICNNKKTLLTEDTIGTLDGADIIQADITINNGKPYIARDGSEKVKAWCNVAYFTIAQSRFASKYDFGEDIE